MIAFFLSALSVENQFSSINEKDVRCERECITELYFINSSSMQFSRLLVPHWFLHTPIGPSNYEQEEMSSCCCIVCGHGGVPQGVQCYERDVSRACFTMKPVSISLFSRLDHFQTHRWLRSWQCSIIWAIPSREVTLVTMEADNSGHLIRRDELNVCFNFF